MNDTKQCPFCAETIKAEAVVCRFCGRDLPVVEVQEPVEIQPPAPTKTRSRIRTILLMIVGVIVFCCVSIFFIGQSGNSSSENDGTTQATSDSQLANSETNDEGEEAAPTSPADDEEEEATDVPPTLTATATPFLVTAVAKQNSNLRSGPGADYEVVGSAAGGESLSVYNRNENGDWLRVDPDEDVWIWVELVELSTEIAAIPVLPTPLPTNTPTRTPAPTNTPRPTSTRDPLQPLVAALDDVLGEVNREGVERFQVSFLDSIIFVTFAVNDNLVTDWIRQGMVDDIFVILYAVKRTNVDYDTVSIQGTFPLRDAFGNVDEGVVVSVVYHKDTIERINFDGQVKVFTIADEDPFIHPDFR